MEKKIKNTPITQLPYKPPLIISIDMWIKISHKLESILKKNKHQVNWTGCFTYINSKNFFSNKLENDRKCILIIVKCILMTSLSLTIDWSLTQVHSLYFYWQKWQKIKPKLGTKNSPKPKVSPRSKTLTTNAAENYNFILGIWLYSMPSSSIIN